MKVVDPVSPKAIIASAQKVFEVEAKAIEGLKERLTEDFIKVVTLIQSCTGKVVICGMGKSGLIGKKIASTLASTGTPSFFMHPAEAFHGDLGMITASDIFLGISNSGETEEVIKLIPALKHNKNTLIAICGRKESTLVKNSDFWLDVSVEEEACPLRLAPTSSTTATLAIGDALAIALMEVRGFEPEDFALFHPGGSLGRKLLTKVKDTMRTDNLPIVSQEVEFHELVLTMTQGKLGLAIVMQSGKIAGIITDGDLRRAWEKYGSLVDKTAEDLMTKKPKTISAEAMLTEAEELLMHLRITSLIVEENDRPIGVLQLYAIGT